MRHRHKQKSLKSGGGGGGGDDDDDAKERAFRFDGGDQRFAALYSAPEFAIDPTSSHYAKTETTAAVVRERAKRMAQLRDAATSKATTTTAATTTTQTKTANAPVSSTARVDALIQSVKRHSLPVAKRSKTT